MTPPVHLSLPEARRLALGAQGFTDPPPRGRVDLRHLRRVLRRVHVLQIDSVNVLVRSHYLPLYSRAGPYALSLLDRAAYRRRELFEYWGHQASLLPVELFPLLRHRMEAFIASPRSRLAAFGRRHAGYVGAVYDEVAEHGPLAASELSDPGQRSGPWWGWRRGKSALEYLFAAGRVTVADRRNFERRYDLTERVLPPEVVRQEAPARDEAQRRLLRLAARSLGVGLPLELADYFRIPSVEARRRLEELVEAGQLLPARVEGWRQQALLDPEARVPRRAEGASLLSPFDSLVWERRRLERLFEFHYRLELYTPAPRRVYGYYVLPFLLGDRLVGRVDLKADRSGGRLLVLGAFAEEDRRASDLAGPLSEELDRMADWLELDGVHVERRGDLARALLSGGRRPAPAPPP